VSSGGGRQAAAYTDAAKQTRCLPRSRAPHDRGLVWLLTARHGLCGSWRVHKCAAQRRARASDRRR
jgi:hypothetical protein